MHVNQAQLDFASGVQAVRLQVHIASPHESVDLLYAVVSAPGARHDKDVWCHRSYEGSATFEASYV